MNKKSKIIIATCIVFICLGFFVMFKTRLFSNKTSYETMPEANTISSEIARNTIIQQSFVCELNSIDKIAVVFTKISECEVSEDEQVPFIRIELLDGETILASEDIDVDKIEDQHRTFLNVGDTSGLNGRELTLKISNITNLNTGLALMIQDNENTSFMYNQMSIRGTICFNISGK